MISSIAFLVCLPLAVYTYAGIFGVIDQHNRFLAILHLTFRVILVALLVALTPAASNFWIGLAFVLVLVLHLASQFALRFSIRSGRWPTERIE